MTSPAAANLAVSVGISPRQTMRGKQVSPPAPFRKGALGSRLEETTHTAGMNPAYLVTR
jgi:hypothetical protein